MLKILQAEVADQVVDDALADLGMALHDGHFRIVELVRLKQDAVGNADLADIVQRRKHEDVLDVAVG